MRLFSRKPTTPLSVTLILTLTRHSLLCTPDRTAVLPLQVAPGISDQTSLTRGETKDKKHRPQNGFKLNDSTVWYDDLRCGDGDNELNWGFWGMLCGPETDTTKEQRFKYQQDAVSLNTKLRETVCCAPLHTPLRAVSCHSQTCTDACPLPLQH